VKQIARRHGYHATFMCRPKLPNVFASGWHLHQSLVSHTSGENAFMAREGAEALSPLGRAWLAGLLAHARASTVFTTPTINGYKRYRTYSLAPDRAIWGRDNRGVMIRVLGGAGDAATRLENRIGEPAANPYLYMASQILSGLDGVDRKLDPGPSADTPYETSATPLPKSLREAVFALDDDRSSARRWAPRSSTITSTSRTPRSSGSRPKCRTGSTANISRCFEGLLPLPPPVIARSKATKQSIS
jgi:glutamine synthetase